MYDRYEQLRLEGFKHSYCVRLLGLDDWWESICRIKWNYVTNRPLTDGENNEHS